MEVLATRELNKPDLSFADVNGVAALRQEQDNLIQASIAEVLAPAMADATNPVLAVECALKIPEARARVMATFDEHRKNFLDAHLNRDDNPERYDTLLDMLRITSLDAMDTVQWLRGERDDEGELTKPETSGRAIVKRTLAELAPDVPEDTTEQYRDGMQRLAAARTALAELSIERRQKTLNSNSLEEAYEEAQDAYKVLVKEVGTLKVKYWHEVKGLEGDELKAKAVTTLLDEHQAFSLAEQAALEGTRRGRVAMWLGKKHRWAFASGGLGMVSGFGAKWALGLVGGLATGLTGGAALGVAAGAGVAVRAAKGVFTTKVGNTVQVAKHFTTRRDQDNASLHAAADNLDVTDHAALVNAANELLQGTYNSRIETDRKSNQKRMGIAMAIGGVAGLIGAGMEAGAEHAGMSSLRDLTNHNGSKALMSKGGTGGVGNHGAPGQDGNTGGSGQTGGNTPPPKPGVVDGYQTNVQIAHGEGYQQALHELAQQKGINLSDHDSWALYEHLSDKFHGNFLSNDASYKMGDNWGISHPGAAHWNPAVIHEMNAWMNQNGHQDKLTTAAKITKKAAKTALAGQR